MNGWAVMAAYDLEDQYMMIGGLEAGGTKMVCAVGTEDGRMRQRVFQAEFVLRIIKYKPINSQLVGLFLCLKNI